MSEVTTVTATQPLLDTRSASLKSVVDERRMIDLPLNGRNPLELTQLVPGVQITPATSINTGSTRPGQVNLSASGGRGNTISHVLDGGDNSDNYTNVSNVYPNPDALAEFSVQTNNFSAEFGRRLGGVINAITKSGTNELHGSGFEFYRDESLNATNFFTPGKGDGPTATSTAAASEGRSCATRPSSSARGKARAFASVRSTWSRSSRPRPSAAATSRTSARRPGRYRDPRPGHGPAVPRQPDPDLAIRPDGRATAAVPARSRTTTPAACSCR